MPNIERKCLNCGKIILVANWQLKVGRGKFCSHKCKQCFPSVLKGKNLGGKINRICEFCGKSFIARRTQVELGLAKFCSRSCVSKSFKGSNAHNWRNGSVRGGDFVRTSIQNKEWRQSVFIRDRFRCCDCGDETGGNLHAHHIKRFSVLLKEVRDYMPLIKFEEAAMLYSPLWDISNGITLCEGCHIKRHSK